LTRRAEGLFRRRRRSAEELPLRGELLSLAGLEERAKLLAAGFTLAPISRAAGHDVLPRLDANVQVLDAAYRSLALDIHRGAAVAPAAEWLLDNFHLVEAQARAVGGPSGALLPHRCRSSPRASSPAGPHPRPALELIRYSDGRLDAERLTCFCSRLPDRGAVVDR
jgi:cyclic beta-1,2-glucan synthetase